MAYSIIPLIVSKTRPGSKLGFTSCLTFARSSTTANASRRGCKYFVQMNAVRKNSKLSTGLTAKVEIGSFKQDGVLYKLKFWTDDPFAINTLRDKIYRSIWKAFEAEGIELETHAAEFSASFYKTLFRNSPKLRSMFSSMPLEYIAGGITDSSIALW
jgi:small-conductance mechanosensitive channel